MAPNPTMVGFAFHVSQDHAVDVHWNGESVAEASARGVPFDAVDAREIKAVTYSEMALEETGEGCRAYVVFDV